ncbi:flavin reductase family protein (plasmid) [Burkholderia sp. M6-3]
MNALPFTQPEIGESFRAAMRRIASTVTIVTAADGYRRHGMTMTAVSSLSMNPPSMIVCVNQATFLHDILHTAKDFCINVLRHDQSTVSTMFSGKASPDERFAVGNWQRANDVDFLADAQANVFCQKVAALPFGTHTIFIGTVTDVRLTEDDKPLLYRNATYC